MIFFFKRKGMFCCMFKMSWVVCPEFEFSYTVWAQMDTDTTGLGPNACDVPVFVSRTS